MKETLGKLSKETRCFVMASICFFEGFKQLDETTEIHGELLLDVLGLTKEDMANFPMPDYSQVVSNLKPISDPEIRHWIITNTYSPVLQSRKSDALKAFRQFCSDLMWDANEIQESMNLTEELEDIKPIDCTSRASETCSPTRASSSSETGCLVVLGLIIVSIVCLTYIII